MVSRAILSYFRLTEMSRPRAKGTTSGQSTSPASQKQSSLRSPLSGQVYDSDDDSQQSNNFAFVDYPSNANIQRNTAPAGRSKPPLASKPLQQGSRSPEGNILYIFFIIPTADCDRAI